jgi:hypothetical protein
MLRSAACVAHARWHTHRQPHMKIDLNGRIWRRKQTDGHAHQYTGHDVPSDGKRDGAHDDAPSDVATDDPPPVASHPSPSVFAASKCTPAHAKTAPHGGANVASATHAPPVTSVEQYMRIAVVVLDVRDAPPPATAWSPHLRRSNLGRLD